MSTLPIPAAWASAYAKGIDLSLYTSVRIGGGKVSFHPMQAEGRALRNRSHTLPEETAMDDALVPTE